jgi:Spy/CpxP family protein refolding chaperone
MKSSVLVSGLMAGALMLWPLVASAQQKDPMTQKHFQGLVNDLKLTPDQQSRLKTQHQQMREEGKAVFKEMKKVREKVRAELLKDKPSKPALDEYATQLAGLHKQLIQKRHEHLLQAKAILTPEQFSKLVNREESRPGPEGDGRQFHGKERHGPPSDDTDDR